MADTPQGLVPVRYLNGAPYNGVCRPYYTDGTTALFIGDPVTQAGTLNAAAVGNYKIGELETVKIVTAAANTVPICGVVVACDPLNGPGGVGRDSTIYAAITVPRVVWVVDDPLVVFQIQEDDGAAAIALTNAAMNFDLVDTAAGSTVTGISGWELDSSTSTVTATGDVQVLNISRIEDNAFGGGNVKWDVRINLHRFNSGTLGIA
jgi:hypothetical protein